MRLNLEQSFSVINRHLCECNASECNSREEISNLAYSILTRLYAAGDITDWSVNTEFPNFINIFVRDQTLTLHGRTFSIDTLTKDSLIVMDVMNE